MSIYRYLKNPCYLYFSLWCFYLLQGTFYESGSIISQAILFVILIISLGDMIRVNMIIDKPLYFKGLNYLFSLFTIYGIILMIVDGAYVKSQYFSPPTYNYLRTIYYSILPVYSCYYYTYKGYINDKSLQKWVIVFMGVAILEYFRIKDEELHRLLDAGSNRTEMTNNIGYMMLLLTPCCFAFKKVMIRVIYISISLSFVFFSMKRGAILIAAICILMLLWSLLKKTNSNKKIAICFVVCVALYFVVGFIENFASSSEFFQQRLEETLSGNSSGRDSLFTNLIDHFLYKANLFQILFGMGAEGTIKVTYNYAHNDWLELLTNQGLLGLVAFFLYWIFFYKTIKSSNEDSMSRFVLKYIYVIMLLRTLFSMSIGDMNIYSSCMLGYALAYGFENNIE